MITNTLLLNKTGRANSRSSNFEFLRIICMLMIICGHIIMYHKYEIVGDSSWLIGQVVRPFCMVAVNVFVLISGYFGIKLNTRKLWSLNGMVTFYSVLFLAIAIGIGIHQLSIQKDWMQFLPVITRQYWFVTVYFALCLVSPFLNKLVEVMDKEMYKKLLMTFFALFCFLPTFAVILNFKTITLDSGYGLVNFIFIYLLGRYIRLHYTMELSKYKYLGMYIASMSVMAAFQIYYSKILGFDFDALISYDTLFTFVGAVCLFMFFREWGGQFSNNLINRLAKPCLAVYVIHLNPIMCDYIFLDLLHVQSYRSMEYLLLLLIVPLLVYLICAIIEYFRMLLFENIENEVLDYCHLT